MADIGGIGNVLGKALGMGESGGGGGLLGLPSLGKLAEKACDLIGLDERIGDLVAVGVDAYSGNWLAVAQEAPDLLEDFTAAPEPEPTPWEGPPSEPYAAPARPLRA